MADQTVIEMEKCTTVRTEMETSTLPSLMSPDALRPGRPQPNGPTQQELSPTPVENESPPRPVFEISTDNEYVSEPAPLTPSRSKLKCAVCLGIESRASNSPSALTRIDALNRNPWMSISPDAANDGVRAREIEPSATVDEHDAVRHQRVAGAQPATE